MNTSWGPVDLPPESYAEFERALQHVVRMGLMNLEPWRIYATEDEACEVSEDLNGRYPTRKVQCFAERVDTDDVACLVLSPAPDERAGSIIVVHDFADRGWEVAAVFPDLWEWFRSAVEDMITLFREVSECGDEGGMETG